MRSPQAAELVEHLQPHLRDNLLIVRDNRRTRCSRWSRNDVLVQRGRLWVEFLPASRPKWFSNLRFHALSETPGPHDVRPHIKYQAHSCRHKHL
jgi:hypothetical protein